ncbi:MAG: HEAT repeat domain-containing protein [Polyangia bacterium]|jgi:hypothetical protein|nr:HEAT repeat domain-containing protein [Polyangia bacterium]
MRRATWILLLSVVALNVASQAYAVPMTSYIRERSTSVGTDMALRFAYFALMLLTAFVEALLFDELVYRGGWRKRFFGGQRGGAFKRRLREETPSATESPASPPGAGNDPEEDAALEEAIAQRRGGLRALVAENSVPFFLAFFVLLGANYLLFNVVNGWFDLYYSRTGHLMTQLRSNDPKEREQAILGLAAHRGEQIERRLLDRLEAGSDGERRWAAWAIGYRRRIRLPLASQGTLDRAEVALIALLQRGTPAQKSTAAVALARMVEGRGESIGAQVVPALRAHLEAEQAAGELTMETVVAMGILRERAAVPLLAPMLRHANKDRALAASWAIGRMQHPSALGPLLAALAASGAEPAPSPEVRCGIVESLGQLGDAARVSKALMDEFNRKGSDFKCETRALVLRPDGRGRRLHDKIHVVSTVELYRIKLLRSLGRVGFLDDAMPWLKRIADPGSPYPQEVRAYAGEQHRALARQMALER